VESQEAFSSEQQKHPGAGGYPHGENILDPHLPTGTQVILGVLIPVIFSFILQYVSEYFLYIFTWR